MERIRASALRHNAPQGVYTALLYQSGWFVQWKEGPGDALLKLMARVEADARHHSMRIVHSSRGPRLLSGPWSMAIVQCDDTPQHMAARVLRLHMRMENGRQYSPVAVWRQLSTPMEHPGAAQQADPDAFQRILVCAAAGSASFEFVNWLSTHHAQPVVHRRFAGEEGLDVGSDYVDFSDDDRVVRVIAMARNGLTLPLTRAFLPDYSHILLLLCGDRQRDLALVHRVAEGCAGLPSAPVLLGVGAPEHTRGEPFALARRAGLIYLDVHANAQDAAAVWSATHPLLARWRETGHSGPISTAHFTSTPSQARPFI